MRILVADDDLLARKLAASMLEREGFEVVIAADGHDAWSALSAPDAPQLALLDWLMPRMDGPDICRKLRERRHERLTYLVLLTAKSNAADLVAGLEAGADDYLTKPFNPLELRVRLRNAKRLIDLHNELTASREAFRHQAHVDPLTKVWNRRRLREYLDVESQRAARTKSPVSIVMIDVDHFKAVNDRFGHAAGDVVLCEVARRISREIRPYDAVGRYGGEEFAVILPGCDLADARGVAERMRAALSSEPMVTTSGPVTVTASLGVAMACFERALENVDQVIERADAALYRAKHTGRNRVCSEESAWTPSIEERA